MSATSPSASDRREKGLNRLVIGIPESARVAGFLDAAAAAGWPPCAVASWRDVLPESWQPPASLFPQPVEGSGKFGARGASSRFEKGGLPP